MSQSQLSRLPRPLEARRRWAGVQAAAQLSEGAERMLRDMAFVYHLTSQVRTAMAAEAIIPVSDTP